MAILFAHLLDCLYYNLSIYYIYASKNCNIYEKRYQRAVELRDMISYDHIINDKEESYL